jgi:hypothetical protein
MGYTITVPVERWTQLPWRERSWRCRLGAHTYAALTNDDVASATQVCGACGFVWHFPAKLLIECIRRRDHILIRENSHKPVARERSEHLSPPSSEEDGPGRTPEPSLLQGDKPS